MKLKYEQYIDLNAVKDFVQCDRHETIARLETNDAWVYLDIVEANETQYQNLLYYDYSDFPKELKELINSNDEWRNDENVEFWECQYLELYCEDKNGIDYWDEAINCCDEVFNTQGRRWQPNQIFNVLYDFYKKTRGEAK